MIASLPMYDRPETAATNDQLWALMASEFRNAAHKPGNAGQPPTAPMGGGFTPTRGRAQPSTHFFDDAAIPKSLDRRSALVDMWRAPNLVLSQTCGMPFKLWVHTHAQLVASPDLHLPDTPPGYYHSVIIARCDDARSTEDLLKARPIINGPDSQSGFNALWTYAHSLGACLAPLRISGAHQASAKAVADGHADIAAIDANTWRFIERWDGFASTLTVRTRTPNTPALPFICGPNQNSAVIRDALAAAIRALTPEQQDKLGLYGLVEFPMQSYLDVQLPPAAQIKDAT